VLLRSNSDESYIFVLKGSAKEKGYLRQEVFDDFLRVGGEASDETAVVDCVFLVHCALNGHSFRVHNDNSLVQIRDRGTYLHTLVSVHSVQRFLALLRLF
jgi:hypothetical protein